MVHSKDKVAKQKQKNIMCAMRCSAVMCPQIFIYEKQNIHSTNARYKESYLNRTRLSCTLSFKGEKTVF